MDETAARLAELREHTSRLANGLRGTLRRVSVSVGDATIEVEWQPQPEQAVAPVGTGQVPEPAQEAEETDECVLVRSPMVGTFYRAPSPDAPPFVEVGAVVKAGQPIAVIEAMKLFNPIDSDVSGVVVEVLVEDAAPVEFGQPLLRVKAEE
ncbi:acetyl-CoA carboxylase biotin carboxyl carrier protein [Lentzea nigeriaca]|uniref:acetyl-CoA carboxylase biotin carboxyl carrier protein n=1 Tax=Lentzea nigeriaca TaxID=1128665 RepID=UPI00195E2AA4|nr:acetyl-CoA carboxylase biotin carboxyl carrier protein [Lentzea nigeriaca]MBM7856347.1 acetyl-CoA carboxylase biotin carboxyl carrier protein [Lentzea nigeriaca]